MNERTLQLLALVRFGRFDDIQELNTRPENNDIAARVWDFGQGYSRLRKGEKDLARAYVNRVGATAETSKATFRVHNARDLLGILGAMLEGEIDRSDGKLDRAMAHFERGAV
jgi:hypothetical protein